MFSEIELLVLLLLVFDEPSSTVEFGGCGECMVLAEDDELAQFVLFCFAAFLEAGEAELFQALLRVLVVSWVWASSSRLLLSFLLVGRDFSLLFGLAGEDV